MLGAAALCARLPLAAEPPALLHPDERHLRNLRQLTFGGENAEAYWSPDGSRLIFQSSREGVPCDQQFVLELSSGESRRVSNGQGKTTCGYFLDGGRRVLYASTHLASPECPPRPDYSRGYVWPMYAGYDLFSAAADGSDLRRLTETSGYDAEATLSPDGKTIVFTSVRDGDMVTIRQPVDFYGVNYYNPLRVAANSDPEDENPFEFLELVGYDKTDHGWPVVPDALREWLIILRARYRNGWEQAELLTPGGIYEFTFQLYPTSNIFRAGHSIRLDISSSNFPRFDVNPNTGGVLGQERRIELAHQTIYHDREYPSHIVLPIIRR